MICNRHVAGKVMYYNNIKQEENNMLHVITVITTPGRKMSCATRTRARGYSDINLNIKADHDS